MYYTDVILTLDNDNINEPILFVNFQFVLSCFKLVRLLRIWITNYEYAVTSSVYACVLNSRLCF